MQIEISSFPISPTYSGSNTELWYLFSERVYTDWANADKGLWAWNKGVQIANMETTVRRAIRAASFIALIACVCVAPRAMAQEADSPEPYTYVSFLGETPTLYPYTGRNVALLVPSPDLDQATLGRIVEAFDAAYDYYHRATGREPQLYYQYEGLATIAVVPETYGGGAGFLGMTGIELMDNNNYSAWDILCEGVLRRNEFDQVTFYELGRNFWFYSDGIEHKGRLENAGSLTTGYAVFMRFMAMEAAGVTPGPFNGISFDYFRSEVEGMLQRYLRDESLSWNNTLYADGGGRAPFNPIGLGNTDLFASFLFERRELYGDTFIDRL